MSSSFTQPEVLVALGVLAGVVVGIGLLARRLPLGGYGGLWMLVCILPVSHIIPIQEVVAEHYLYVPLFGFCLLVGIVLDALCGESLPQRTLWARLRVGAVYTLLLVILTGAVSRTITRNRDWVDEETFWTTVTYTAPQGARAHYNLAGVYARTGRADDAARHFMWTLSLSPRHVGAIVGLGELAFASGQHGSALAYVTQAQQINPRHPRVIYLLSWVKLALREMDEAEELFQQAVILMPNYPGVYAGLEEVAKARGDEATAAQWAEKRRLLEARSGQTG